MTFEGVPWAVGGGAELTTESLRLVAYAASSAAEGVINPGDLDILAMPTPSGNVRWSPGAAILLRRASGGSHQAYTVRNPIGSTEIVTPIAAQGAGSSRTDLIVVRVEDPQDGWPAAPDLQDGPYVYPRVISGVPATTKYAWELGAPYNTQTLLAIARVTVPASTSIITQGMITRVADLAIPRSKRDVQMNGDPGATDDLTATGTPAPWIRNAEFNVYIPPWATHCNVMCRVINAIHMTGNVFGTVALYIGGTGTANARTGGTLAASGPYANDWAGATTRTSVDLMNQIAIQSAWRNTTKKFDLRAYRAVTTGLLRSDSQTRVILDLDFVERQP